jgi:hypothetical protein
VAGGTNRAKRDIIKNQIKHQFTKRSRKLT